VSVGALVDGWQNNFRGANNPIGARELHPQHNIIEVGVDSQYLDFVWGTGSGQPPSKRIRRVNEYHTQIGDGCKNGCMIQTFGMG
jgi:hypothetical protein